MRLQALTPLKHTIEGVDMNNSRRLSGCLIAMLLIVATGQAQVQLPVKKTLTLEAAKQLVSGVSTVASKNSWTMVTAVVDAGGHLVILERMDNAQTGSIEVAMQKARTAIAFKRSTKTFEDRTLAGRTVLLGIPGVIPIEGGLPIIVDGQFVGAIGVSGGSSEQDGIAAQAALDAFKVR
jgi:uncharacterized protein GlcG (DUF336 family)